MQSILLWTMVNLPSDASPAAIPSCTAGSSWEACLRNSVPYLKIIKTDFLASLLKCESQNQGIVAVGILIFLNFFTYSLTCFVPQIPYL